MQRCLVIIVRVGATDSPKALLHGLLPMSLSCKGKMTTRTEQLKKLGKVRSTKTFYTITGVFIRQRHGPNNVTVRTAQEGYSPSRPLSGDYRLLKAHSTLIEQG
jgi:hypothetical protein